MIFIIYSYYYYTIINIEASKFNIAITVFKTCKRKISILNIKYYESRFENLRVRKTAIMITKLYINNSKKSNNEYYYPESIFKKFIS